MGCCGGTAGEGRGPACHECSGSPSQVEAGQADGPPAQAQMTVAPVEAVSGRFLLLGGPGGPLQPGEVLRLQLRDLGPPPAPRLFHVLVSPTSTQPLGIHPLTLWGPPGTSPGTSASPQSHECVWVHGMYCVCVLQGACTCVTHACHALGCMVHDEHCVTCVVHVPCADPVRMACVACYACMLSYVHGVQRMLCVHAAMSACCGLHAAHCTWCCMHVACPACMLCIACCVRMLSSMHLCCTCVCVAVCCECMLHTPSCMCISRTACCMCNICMPYAACHMLHGCPLHYSQGVPH